MRRAVGSCNVVELGILLVMESRPEVALSFGGAVESDRHTGEGKDVDGLSEQTAVCRGQPSSR